MKFRTVFVKITLSVLIMFETVGPGSPPVLGDDSQVSPSRVVRGAINVQAQYPFGDSLFLWLPGSMGWPNLRLDIVKRPETRSTTFETVEFSNRYLTDEDSANGLEWLRETVKRL